MTVEHPQIQEDSQGIISLIQSPDGVRERGILNFPFFLYKQQNPHSFADIHENFIFDITKHIDLKVS